MRIMRMAAVLAAGALAVALTACGGERSGGGQRLSIATGNTTGVYYVLGGGIAEQINKNLDGYQATAEATGASVENIQRVVRGDSDIAFTLADTAADAASGKGSFAAPQPIRALARLYDNYTHVIARADAGIKTVADLKGKRVSTGSPNSGTEVIALRLLAAAGLDPDKDVTRQALSLPETVQGVKDETIDALVWSGGLPTGGITDLITSEKDEVVFVPLDDVLPAMQREHGQVYAAGTIPAAAYSTPGDVATIVVPNLLVVNQSMDAGLAERLTGLLFDRKAELEKVHAAAKEITRENAPKTEPVLLHDGAKRYFGS
ncbi:hypothetical protein HNP84_001258 [Thermocatellispora tengchongensis]|uniref:TAXI family TRAP transporter solute-binding subunit n=1 Tax=Thermocatellispora tengchongensis TaxID=1073253 RepID=A0A840NWG7_9ACTN|nr:TAXI family TRAP transporter solute-binding subunit [Thermocatellispora tengchongensis]MBB5131552.1 hypothetical protein [Thermocatellispora tengchongensis]